MGKIFKINCFIQHYLEEMTSGEKEQARLLKLYEKINSGSNNSESECDADGAENNSSSSV